MGAFASNEPLERLYQYESALAACAPQIALGEPGLASLSAGALLFGAKREGPNKTQIMHWGDTLAAFLARLDNRLWREIGAHHYQASPPAAPLPPWAALQQLARDVGGL